MPKQSFPILARPVPEPAPHVRKAGFEAAAEMLRLGQYVVLTPTYDGLAVGDPQANRGLMLRPAAGRETTHVDIYAYHGANPLTFRGTYGSLDKVLL